MYLVVTGEQSTSFETLSAAVEEAKRVSRHERGQVIVRDEREQEQLVYRHGSLHSYVYETHRK